MSKQASQFQKKVMSLGYRGKEIFKPLNTGWIDEHVACVREWVANIFFYTKNGTTVMIDAGYNYDRLAEKMGWLDIPPASIRHILITHQDTDHVGAVERDSGGLFRGAVLYIGEVENRYLMGETRRKVIFGQYKLPQVYIDNEKRLLRDGDVFYIDDIKVECFLVPGHTWGHMVYLIDDGYLFTGDTLWFGADGGYSFINTLAEDNTLAKRSLAELEGKLRLRGLQPKIITGHTGWTDDFEFAFRHRDKVCNSIKKQKPHDPAAPYDAYDESDDTEALAQSGRLRKAGDTETGGRYAKIRKSYEMAGKTGSFYDGMITYTRPLGKLVNRAVWGYDRECTDEWLKKTLDHVPEGFAGHLLEVPVGTGVLTMSLYETLPNAEITCLDYSPDMMKNAQKRAAEIRLHNVRFLLGDVGKLPFEDESFDLVLSLNGFHAFPDKTAAYRETYRVLKKGGIFTGCFYVEGVRTHTDKMIRRFYIRSGFFTPPFETLESLQTRLEGMYSNVETENVKSIGIFRCVK